MRKLALPDDVLLKVDKAARYIGNEVNSIVKNPAKVDVRIAMCFPDVYEIGMSHLGIQILYEMFNSRPDVWCERVYSPWPDLHKVMKEQGIGLFGLESQEPVRKFDFMGITLQYEMCYTNMLGLIDLAGLPLYAKERTDDMPLVVAGGPCTYNPEPIAPFIDFFYIGDGETVYDRVIDLYKEMKALGTYSRKTFLREASHIPGIYVPSLYEVTYNADKTICSFEPLFDDVPAKIRRQVVTDLDRAPYPEKPVVPHVRAIQDRSVIEVMRGCIRGCRFCQAGETYRPNRERSLETVEKYALAQLKATGYEEISLSSLSTSDYSRLPELIDFLIDHCGKNHVNISLPSLRIDAFSLDVMSKVQDIRKSSLTFAAEAGSQRLRDVINKGITKEDILAGSEAAFEGGWNRVKLYFMLGLPTETEEDRRAIGELADEIAALYYDTVPKEKRTGRVNINVSTSFFVPKPFTPFQWYRMFSPSEYLTRAKCVNDTIKSSLNHKSITYNWHDGDISVLEGIFALGDRRVAPAIKYAYEHGALFDAWNDFFQPERWTEAFAATGVDTDFYVGRIKPFSEILPWDFIDCGISRKFLEGEWERAMSASVTRNCREGCSGCGCASYSAGICPGH